jgi:hypothetical protein
VNPLGLPTREIRALHPDVVSMIMRDPMSPYFPSRIGVFCDECWTVDERDYMVDDSMTKLDRLKVARDVLAALGWSITPEADLCPSCATTHAQEGL